MLNNAKHAAEVEEETATALRPLRFWQPSGPWWRDVLAFRPQRIDNDTGFPTGNYSVSFDDIPGVGVVARTDAAIAQRIIGVDDDESCMLRVGKAFHFRELHPALSSSSLAPSHGLQDKRTGEYFNIAYEVMPGARCKHTVFRVSSDGKCDILATFNRPMSYLHSALLTPNYVVLPIPSIEVNMLTMLRSASFSSAMRMSHNRPAEFLVISRDGSGVVESYEHPPFYAMHPINAHETDGGDILLDLGVFRDLSILSSLLVDKLRAGGHVPAAQIMRFSLRCVGALATDPDAVTAEVSRKAESLLLSHASIEMPSVAPNVEGRAYRFAYGVSSESGRFFGTMVKVDVETTVAEGGGKVAAEYSKDGVILGEPVFVADPDGVQEDDGCVLFIAIDTVRESSALMVLNARNFQEMARVEVPFVVPVGFHGCVRGVDLGGVN